MQTKPEQNQTNPHPIEGRAATLNDIAQALGLTQATVSYALSGKGRVAPQTRQAVLDTAKKLDFRPNPHAQRLIKGRSNDTVGLFAWSLDLGVATLKLQILQNLLVQQGFRAPIHVCGNSPLTDDTSSQVEAMRNLCAQSPRAIVCNMVSLRPEVWRELERFRAQGGLVICYDSPVEAELDQVLFDREHNAYLAARHLLELGHREIAFYGGWDKPNPQRKAGFERALAEFDLKPQPKWTTWQGDDEARAADGFCEQAGLRLANLFMALKKRPTAIQISDDIVAAVFMTELLRRGVQIPEEISIVGADDLPLATYISAIALTTVSQPVAAIAAAVVELLKERIGDTSSHGARQIIVQGELVPRQSTKALVAGAD